MDIREMLLIPYSRSFLSIMVKKSMLKKLLELSTVKHISEYMVSSHKMYF